MRERGGTIIVPGEDAPVSVLHNIIRRSWGDRQLRSANEDEGYSRRDLTLAKKEVSSSSAKSRMSSSMKLAGVKLRLCARRRVLLSLNDRP